MMYLPKDQKAIRVFSYGAGVQSFAVLVLQAQGLLSAPFDYFVFANVGSDSENPATIQHYNEVAKPFAEAHGIKLIEITKKRRGGADDTVLSLIERSERSIPIPARMSNGAPGNRTCTVDFKIRVVDRWLYQSGFTHALVGVGISIDEARRKSDEAWMYFDASKKLSLSLDQLSNPLPRGFFKSKTHPLIDLGISRQRCLSVIAAAGLSLPPKSSCWFCPFKSRGEWVEMKRLEPDRFQQAVELEQLINRRRSAMGRDAVYLHPSAQLLTQAVGDQMGLWDRYQDIDEVCQSAVCGL